MQRRHCYEASRTENRKLGVLDIRVANPVYAVVDLASVSCFLTNVYSRWAGSWHRGVRLWMQPYVSLWTKNGANRHFELRSPSPYLHTSMTAVTAAATAAAIVAIAAVATAAAVASHLGQSRVDLLLSLLQDCH